MNKRIKRAGLWFLIFLAVLFGGKGIVLAVCYLAFTPYGDYIMVGATVVTLAWVAWWVSGDLDDGGQNQR